MTMNEEMNAYSQALIQKLTDKESTGLYLISSSFSICCGVEGGRRSYDNACTLRLLAISDSAFLHTRRNLCGP